MIKYAKVYFFLTSVALSLPKCMAFGHFFSNVYVSSVSFHM